MREPVIWLRGKRVGIGALRADLVPAHWEWENDPGAILGYGHQVRGALNQVRFTVYDLDGEPSPVGLSTLLVDHQVRTAEFIIVLGAAARGRGLATEATLLTLDYGFHVSAPRMIWLKVLEPNPAGIRAYTSAGFKSAGGLRQPGYRLGEVCDEILMDALKEDFPRRCSVTEQAGGHARRCGVEPLVGGHKHGVEVPCQQHVQRVVGRDSPFEGSREASEPPPCPTHEGQFEVPDRIKCLTGVLDGQYVLSDSLSQPIGHLADEVLRCQQCHRADGHLVEQRGRFLAAGFGNHPLQCYRGVNNQRPAHPDRSRSSRTSSSARRAPAPRCARRRIARSRSTAWLRPTPDCAPCSAARRIATASADIDRPCASARCRSHRWTSGGRLRTWSSAMGPV